MRAGAGLRCVGLGLSPAIMALRRRLSASGSSNVASIGNVACSLVRIRYFQATVACFGQRCVRRSSKSQTKHAIAPSAPLRPSAPLHDSRVQRRTARLADTPRSKERTPHRRRSGLGCRRGGHLALLQAHCLVPAFENRRGNASHRSLQRAVETSRARRRLAVKHCYCSTRQAGRRMQEDDRSAGHRRRGGGGEDPEVRGQVGEVLRRARLLHRVGALSPTRPRRRSDELTGSSPSKFHPDKNPGDQRALRKFNRVARANEVLTDDEQRKKLDYYTENPSEYWSLYGTFVDFSYAPKTSLKGVLFILLVFAALVQPALQYSKYQEYTKALVKAALARAPEGAVFRKEADEIVAEESKKRKKGKKTKMTSQEEKALLKETLQKLVAKSELPDEYAFPSLRDNLFVKVALYPLSMFKSNARSSELKKKIASGQVLDADEAQEVIEGYLGGADAWDALSRERAAQIVEHKMLPQGELRQVAVDATGSGVAHEGVDEARDPPAEEGRAGVRHGRGGLLTQWPSRRRRREKRSGSQVKNRKRFRQIACVRSRVDGVGVDTVTRRRRVTADHMRPRHPHRRRSPRRPRPAARPRSPPGMVPSVEAGPFDPPPAFPPASRLPGTRGTRA